MGNIKTKFAVTFTIIMIVAFLVYSGILLELLDALLAKDTTVIALSIGFLITLILGFILKLDRIVILLRFLLNPGLFISSFFILYVLQGQGLSHRTEISHGIICVIIGLLGLIMYMLFIVRTSNYPTDYNSWEQGRNDLISDGIAIMVNLSLGFCWFIYEPPLSNTFDNGVLVFLMLMLGLTFAEFVISVGNALKTMQRISPMQIQED